MSKYRLLIKRSRLALYTALIFAALGAWSVVLWPQVWDGQRWLQGLLISLCFVALVRWLMRWLATSEASLEVGTNGELYDPQSGQQWRIAHTSLTGPVVICLRLLSATFSHARVIWIFRDAVNDMDFRRLSRIVHQQRYKGQHDSGNLDR